MQLLAALPTRIPVSPCRLLADSFDLSHFREPSGSVFALSREHQHRARGFAVKSLI